MAKHIAKRAGRRSSKTRAEWVDFVDKLLNDDRSAKPRFTYNEVGELWGFLKAISEAGWGGVELPKDFGVIIREGMLREAQRLLARLRKQSRRGDVSELSKRLCWEFSSKKFAPTLVGTSMDEIEQLIRQGYAARARGTIANARSAIKHRKVHAMTFHGFGVVKKSIEMSGLPVQAFGFATEEEFRQLERQLALPFLRNKLSRWIHRSTYPEVADEIRRYQREYKISDEEIGLIPEDFERIRQQSSARQAEGKKASEAYWAAENRPGAVQHALELLAELRAGVPQSREPSLWDRSHHGKRPLSGLLADRGLRIADIGSTEEEVRHLDQRWPELHARYLADRYRKGEYGPSDMLASLERLGIHPSVVGISPAEAKLFQKGR